MYGILSFAIMGAMASVSPVPQPEDGDNALGNLVLVCGDRLGDLVGVIRVDEFYLLAVDPALFVDIVDVVLCGNRIGRPDVARGAGQVENTADLDGLLGKTHTAEQKHRIKQPTKLFSCFPPFFCCILVFC